MRLRERWELETPTPILQHYVYGASSLTVTLLHVKMRDTDEAHVSFLVLRALIVIKPSLSMHCHSAILNP